MAKRKKSSTKTKPKSKSKAVGHKTTKKSAKKSLPKKKITARAKSPRTTPSPSKQQETSKTIAPHFDTQDRSTEPNTNVEMPSGTAPDSFQTDSRPKGS